MDKPIENAMDLVTLEEGSRLFGCTTQALRDCIKRGMPHARKGEVFRGRPPIMISLSATKEWGTINKVKAFKIMPDNSGLVVSTPKTDSEPKAIEPSSLGLAASLDFMRKAEYRARADYATAIRSQDRIKIQLAQRVHLETHKQLEATEKHVDYIKEAQQIAWEEVKKAIHSWTDPIKEFLHSWPQSIAGRLNPVDPMTAEKFLKESINSQLLPLMARKLQTK